MQFEGQLKKMNTEHLDTVRYYLNQLIGKEIKVSHLHYQCIGCQQDLKIYRQGFCKNCFFESPYANENIIRPELSTAHLNIEKRDLAWEKKFELQPHIVYLAISSGLKVGVTRVTQIPTRWIDQGASSAILFAETENRYEAGMIEVELAKQISDKTNYRKMLKNEIVDLDLISEKERLKFFIPAEFASFYSNNNEITTINYPIENYPTKVNSINLSKTPSFTNTISGIKGQYLLFENEEVFNVRSHEGFYVSIEILN
jgi:hypothetical protein